MHKPRRRALGAAVLAATLAFGGAVVTTAPASAAGRGSVTLAPTYSKSSTVTTGSTKSRAWATHGCRSVSTSWTLANVSVKVSCGNRHGSAGYAFR
jgi:hypothetical protein